MHLEVDAIEQRLASDIEGIILIRQMGQNTIKRATKGHQMFDYIIKN
jgi:hypothetical protein